MSETVKMPTLGLSIQEGTFLDWKKEVGQMANKGDIIAEVEADKATIEVEAPTSGILLEKLVNSGDTVIVGQPIARLSGASESAESEAPDLSQHADVKPVVPQAQEKADRKESADKQQQPAQAAPAAESNGDLPGGVKASPLARRIAEERGINLRQVTGTGPGGRITKTDVENFKPAPAQASQAAEKPAAAPEARPQIAQPTYATGGADTTEEPLTRMRQIIARRTTEAKQTIPHFYMTVEIDMAPLMALRKQINEGLPEDQKVTVNDLLVKAAALALRKFPNLNSHFGGDKVIRHQRINIGIAVALENGLINVVAKDADILSISRLAQRNKEMIASARAGKIRLEDMEGATFTVSNLGPYDVEHFEAIISPPEAAILAVASAREVPVVVNGEIKVGLRMKASLSVDHRVSDGAEGAQYLKEFRAILESPMRLLI